MGDSKVESIQTHFKALSSVAISLNTASDELTKAVSVLDEALKKLNIGLTVWVNFRIKRFEDPEAYDVEQIGYSKVSGKWGICLRRVWGDLGMDRHDEEGPWLFSDAPRELRLHAVDKLPELIEALNKTADDTTKKVQTKTREVRELANVVANITTESQKPPRLAEAFKTADRARENAAKEPSIGDLLVPDSNMKVGDIVPSGPPKTGVFFGGGLPESLDKNKKGGK